MPAIIDAHVHLWDPTTLRMPWLDDVPDLNRPFDIADYAAATAGLDIAGMIYVEVDVAPQYALIEAETVVELAAQQPQLFGVIAAAPLEFGPRTRRYLDALHRLGPLIKGVRRNLQGEGDPQFCLSTDFIAGVQLLAAYDWTFDICIRHEQLAAVTELARRCPQVRFVLDHLGKPPIRLHQLDPWREDLARLAALPNVWIKISGLVTEADHTQWRAEDLTPYIAHALTVFGPSRAMFGGDWPVMTLAATYPQWVEVMADALRDYDAADQEQFWETTARGVYHLAGE